MTELINSFEKYFDYDAVESDSTPTFLDYSSADRPRFGLQTSYIH